MSQKDASQKKLDWIDRVMLNSLQEEGRITNVELARRTGISAPPCLRRMRVLEDEGYIQGYHADVNPELMGYGVTTFAFVGLNNQSERDLKAFEEKIEHWPMVRECYMLQGDVDFLLKIVAKDLASYNTFLTQELTSAPGVAHVKSALCIRSTKRLFGVPIDTEKNEDKV